MTSVTTSAVSGSATLFNTTVDDIQTNVNVSGYEITGTLKYLDSGDIVDTWGAGNFIALQFTDIPDGVTSVKVGLDPSQGSGLVEIIDDPDKNGVFKITDKDTQVFKVVITDGTWTKSQTYDLSKLVCEAF